jgi:cytochrome P450
MPLGHEVVIVTTQKDVTAVLGRNSFGVADVPGECAPSGALFQAPDGPLRLDMPHIKALRAIINPLLTPEGAGVDEADLAQKGSAFADKIMTDDSMHDLTRYTTLFLRAALKQVTGMTDDDQIFFNLLAGSALNTVSTFGRRDSSEIIDEFSDRWQSLYGFCSDLIVRTRHNPNQQLLLAKLIGALEGAGITGDRLLHSFTGVLNGFTTVAPVMNVCISELARSPQLVKHCIENPDQWRPTIEELLRTKAHFGFALPRIALQDIQLDDGTTLSKGTVVLPSLTGALNDPEAVINPQEFDPHKKAKRSLAFGGGPHFCPAAELSLVWLKVGLQSLFTAYPELELQNPQGTFYTRGSLRAPLSLFSRIPSAQSKTFLE